MAAPLNHQETVYQHVHLAGVGVELDIYHSIGSKNKMDGDGLRQVDVIQMNQVGIYSHPCMVQKSVQEMVFVGKKPKLGMVVS